MVLRGQHAGVDAVVRETGQEVVIVIVVVSRQEVVIVLWLHGLQLPGPGEAGVGAELAGQREARLDGEGAGHLVLTQHQEPAAWTILTVANL